MSSTSYSWIWNILCPALGVLLCNMMALSPIQAVLEARRQKELGQLDPLPFALIMNSQLGWTIYGIYLRDYYIFFSSAFPFMFGIVLCLTAIHILERAPQHDEKEQKLRIRIESIMVSSMCYWMFIIMITCLVMSPSDKNTSALIIGLSADVSSLVYYASPLRDILEIIKTKDSSSLYLPSIYISTLNCLLWLVYGVFGVNQILIWIPNIIGFIICMIELLVCRIYPRPSKSFGEAVAEASVHELMDITSRIRAYSTDNYNLVRSGLVNKYFNLNDEDRHILVDDCVEI
jgi:solute carrier family 50 protein (sugar transporter)